MNRKKIFLLGMYATIFIASFGFIMYSALVPAFSDTYHISLAQAGAVGSILCIGQLVIIFFNDYLAERISKPMLIAIGVAVNLVSLFWIAVSASFVSLAAAFFFNGGAISLLNVVMSAYISDIFGEKRNTYLNIFHGIYGLGSLAGPILPTAILVLGGNWKWSYVIMGILSIIIFAVMLGLAIGSKKENQEAEGERLSGTAGYGVKVKKNEPFFKLLRSPRLFIICMATLLFMGFDMTVSTYMSSYLGLKLHAASVAGLTITFYWAGSALGRLIYPVLFARFEVRKYLAIVNIFTAGLLFLGITISRPFPMIVLISLIGLLSGVNFPLEISLACELFPDSSVGATNAVSIFGSLGGIIFPMAAGFLMEHTGYTSLLILGGIMMLSISGCLMLLINMKKKEGYHV